MLGFLGSWLYAIIAAASFGAAWQTQNWRHAANDRDRERVALSDQARRVEHQTVKAEAYERQKIVLRDRFVPITQEVERVVQKIEYRDVCLDDDGLRAVAHALAASPTASQPQSGVSGSGPTR